MPSSELEGAQRRPKKVSTSKVKKKTTQSVQRKRTTSKRRTGKASKKRSKKSAPITSLVVLSEKSLSEGVRYSQYRTNGSQPVVVHVLSMDRTIVGNAIRLIKGDNHAFGLERIADMVRRHDSTSSNTLYGLVNGNFWRAVRNTMIGPCVIDGEVVELNAYKKWSSAFIDVRNAVYIDTFRLSGTVSYSNTILPISTVNRRNDSGVVLYNSFGGSTIPHVSTNEVEKAFIEAIKDSMFVERDSTEAALTQTLLKSELMRAQREHHGEFPMIKIRVRYLRSPSINTTLPCQVLSVDTGAVDMPIRGGILSMPRTLFAQMPCSVGDTVVVSITTNLHSEKRFMNAVCGTPRLVRNGVASQEAEHEGSTGRRFIYDGLARTALGTDRSGNRIMFAAMRPDRPEDRSYGASLKQTAQIMSLLGCYQAMNLDGGGSAGMMVGTDHVFFDGEDPHTRRIGLGLAVVKLSKILRSPR